MLKSPSNGSTDEYGNGRLENSGNDVNDSLQAQPSVNISNSLSTSPAVTGVGENNPGFVS